MLNDTTVTEMVNSLRAAKEQLETSSMIFGSGLALFLKERLEAGQELRHPVSVKTIRLLHIVLTMAQYELDSNSLDEETAKKRWQMSQYHIKQAKSHFFRLIDPGLL